MYEVVFASVSIASILHKTNLSNNADKLLLKRPLAQLKSSCQIKTNGTCGLSVTTFFHQVLNYYYLTVYIMFKPKMSLEGSVH